MAVVALDWGLVAFHLKHGSKLCAVFPVTDSVQTLRDRHVRQPRRDLDIGALGGGAPTSDDIRIVIPWRTELTVEAQRSADSGPADTEVARSAARLGRCAWSFDHVQTLPLLETCIVVAQN